MIQNKALEEIKNSEGCRLKPYYDISGKPTIGWGATFYENGAKVTILDREITQKRADDLLKFHVNIFAVGVKKLLTVSLNQNQFGALVSLAYNIGLGAFSSSTVLRLVNINPLDDKIADAFNMWVNSGGKFVNGLLLRRKREYNLYKSFALSSFLIPLLLVFYTVFIVTQ
jgi:lysozyme